MTILPLRLRAAAHRLMLAALPLGAMLAATAYPGAALADVALRVEARPASAPIQAFVRVTDANEPVEGLTAGHFTITIDGQPITINVGDVTPPPEFDEEQVVSVIFAMDYSGSVTEVALEAMEQAAVDFANAMSDGDQVAILKFNDTNPARASIVLPFTTISPDNTAIEAAIRADYPGDGTNVFDAILVAVDHFQTPPAPLPAGPKAIILITDGGELHSDATQSEAIEVANAAGLPVFSIGVGDIANAGNEELLLLLADETGGQYFPTANEEEIADAYATISILLTSEYLVTIPNGITDCQQHVMVVTVDGHGTDDATFTRRTCDSEPNPFDFGSVTGVNTSRTVTSDPATITGLEVPAHISVIQGRYSIGCTATTTEQPGTIENGDTVCVSHQTSAEFSTTKTTTLTIGGIAGTFTSTTRAEEVSGGGGGGGGATGLLELLLGLGVFLLGRRRLA